LVEEGLLEASFRRPPGRRGPGAGRPSKFYRQAPNDVRVDLPPRNYELAARIFRHALSESDADEQKRALRAARKIGRTLAREAAGRMPGRDAKRRILETWLGSAGYRPSWRASRLDLANCPFKALVGDCPDLICTANLGLMEGFALGLGVHNLRPILDCRPDVCCVSFLPRAS
jgi:predicted ArsR family transcriptional regulator